MQNQQSLMLIKNQGFFPADLSYTCSSYQIYEFMYEQEHQYDKIIDCYLRDPLREVS